LKSASLAMNFSGIGARCGLTAHPPRRRGPRAGYLLARE
jgi:hypothetical protein